MTRAVFLFHRFSRVRFCWRRPDRGPSAGAESAIRDPQSATKTPVIFDTDICDDIDDTWALGVLLQSPELDCKLITTALRDTEAKAKVVAKFLDKVGRTEYPHRDRGQAAGRLLAPDELGQGLRSGLLSGPGLKDGVQAIIDTIMNSPTRVTLIAVGPLPNIAEALRGSRASPRRRTSSACTAASTSVTAARRSPMRNTTWPRMPKPPRRSSRLAWPMTITPLDTCGRVALTGDEVSEGAQTEQRHHHQPDGELPDVVPGRPAGPQGPR